ncbi:MAG: twin-arginine translocation signal domain-containing protein [Burkholderiales bacterium]
MENSKTKRSRRTFLLAVGAGGAAAVAAIGAKTLPQTAGASAKKQPEGKGYELTEHVRTYYRTTLV